MTYIAMAALKGKGAPEFFAPLSYGRGQEVAPEQLLIRGRATMFSSEEKARDALRATLNRATNDGAEWPKKFTFAIIEVEAA